MDNSSLSLTAIVLTFNEEKHIRRCIDKLYELCDRIVIVDSFSTDKTTEIAKSYSKVSIFQNPWVNHSSQLNWAISNSNITTDWVIRVDADEYVDEKLKQNLILELPKMSSATTGIEVKRLIYFLGQPLKKAGMYPIWHLKLWRKGYGQCEQKWMDERIILSNGQVQKIEGDLIDNNLNNLTWWTAKHNGYATREAIDILDKIYNFSKSHHGISRKHQEVKRAKFKEMYLKLPLFVRPLLFWFIRYFIQGGFLEGKAGFIWNLLQCGWYRFLVDVKIYEAYKKAGRDKEALIKYFKTEYGYDVTTGSK
jgi:glycosyltransferase involved in cell wall biosynthesis